jgi:hypothetical protein
MTTAILIAAPVSLALLGLTITAVRRTMARLVVHLDADPESAASAAVQHLGTGAGLYRHESGSTELTAWSVAEWPSGPRWRGEVLGRLEGGTTLRQELTADDLADLRSEIVIALRFVRRMRVSHGR